MSLVSFAPSDTICGTCPEGASRRVASRRLPARPFYGPIRFDSASLSRKRKNEFDYTRYRGCRCHVVIKTFRNALRCPLLRRETPELPRFRLKVIPDEKLDFSAFFFFFFFFSRILRTTRVSEALYRKDCGEIRNIGNVRRFRSGTRKFDIVRRESRLRTGLLETIFFITVCTISWRLF